MSFGPFVRTHSFDVDAAELGVALARGMSDEQADALNAFVAGLDVACDSNGSFTGMQLIRIAEGLTARTVEALTELVGYCPQPKETGL